MRSFSTTASIFVIGVLVSKLFAGTYQAPIYNRFAGEIRQNSNYIGPKTGAVMQFEIFNQMVGGSERRFVEFEFIGKPDLLKNIGVPTEKITCDVSTANQVKGLGKSIFFKRAGDHYMCTGLKLIAQQGYEKIAVQFQGKGKVLYTEAGRNNSRGFIVGLMQSMRFSDWSVSKGGV